jgi:hypothetical protein
MAVSVCEGVRWGAAVEEEEEEEQQEEEEGESGTAASAGRPRFLPMVSNVWVIIGCGCCMG